MKGTNLLDIYSGVGTFSLSLKENFEHFTLVEHNRQAITFAEINLQGTNHESFGLSGAKFVQMYEEWKDKRQFDSVVVDPPRSGMENEVSSWISKNQNILHVASLSCDPVTHARDLKKLTQNGFKIEKLYLLDYYPQTSHIESLAILERI